MAQAPAQRKTLRMDEDETFETGEAVTIDDGQHSGTIKDVWGEVTPQGYRYLQLAIASNKVPDVTIRHGLPFPNEGKAVTPASKLGKLLLAFGFEVGTGNAYSIKEIREKLTNAPISFLVMNEEKDKGTFAVVVDDSIKPKKQ